MPAVACASRLVRPRLAPLGQNREGDLIAECLEPSRCGMRAVVQRAAPILEPRDDDSASLAEGDDGVLVFQSFARLPHDGPDQAVREQPGVKLFAGHLGCGHVQHFHFQLGFDVAEVQFGLPALAIPTYEQLDRVVSSRQSGEQPQVDPALIPLHAGR